MEGDAKQSKGNADRALTREGLVDVASASTRAYLDSGYSSPSLANIAQIPTAHGRTTNFPFENASQANGTESSSCGNEQNTEEAAAAVTFTICDSQSIVDESRDNQFGSSHHLLTPQQRISTPLSYPRRHSCDSLQSPISPLLVVQELNQQRRLSDTQVSVATAALPEGVDAEDIDDESHSSTRPRSASSPLVRSLVSFGETLRDMGDRFEADHLSRRNSLAAMQADGPRIGHRAITMCRRAVSSLSSLRSSIRRRARASLPAIMLTSRERTSLQATYDEAVAASAASPAQSNDDTLENDTGTNSLHDEVDGAIGGAQFDDGLQRYSAATTVEGFGSAMESVLCSDKEEDAEDFAAATLNGEMHSRTHRDRR